MNLIAVRAVGLTIVFALLLLLTNAQEATVSVNLINGDANRDNKVDDADLTAVLFAFGTNNAQADLNGDGTVDDSDLTTVLFSFGQAGASSLEGDRVAAYGGHFLNVQVNLQNACASCSNTVYVEAQRPDDVLVYQMVGTIQGATGTVSLGLPEAGIYRLQVWVANGSWLRAEVQVGVGLQIRDLMARPGNGCAVLMWDELPNDSFSGYRVYRRSGTGQWTQIATLPAEAFLYADTGLTNGVTYRYKLSVVGLDGTVLHEAETSVVPTSAVARLIWDSQSYTSDGVQVTARMSSGSLPIGYKVLIVDGIPWGGLGEWADAPERLLGFVKSSDLPLRSHTLQAVCVTETHAFATPVVSLTFGTDAGVLEAPNLVYVGGRAQFRMELPTDVVSWSLKIIQPDNQEVRSWSGSTSLIDVLWDVRDSNGDAVNEGLYYVQVSATRASGQSLSVTQPFTVLLRRFAGPIAAVALLDGDVGNRSVIFEVANWIAARYNIIKQRSGGSFTYYVYVYSQSRHNNRPAHRRFMNELLFWMGYSLQVFYMYGHGDRAARGFWWGGYYFASYISHGPRVISIPLVVGDREYKFVFIDACHSASTDALADAFNAYSFLGWARAVPVFRASNDPFVLFTKYVWGDLAAGYRISQALNFTCQRLGRSSLPCQGYRLTCDPFWMGYCWDISLP